MVLTIEVLAVSSMYLARCKSSSSEQRAIDSDDAIGLHKDNLATCECQEASDSDSASTAATDDSYPSLTRVPSVDSMESLLRLESDSDQESQRIASDVEVSQVLPYQRPARDSYARWSIDEVRRHDSATDCWLIADGNVYDATQILKCHPGGVDSILRKSGGKDATRDYHFHSRRGQQSWERNRIGVLDTKKLSLLETAFSFFGH